MEKIRFTTSIHAPKEKIWEVLWNENSYRDWTRVFAEGSTVKTDNWKEGSKVLFLDGEGRGMVSRVVANRPNEYMSFEHLGEVAGGVEDTVSEKIKEWKGAHENYTLEEAGKDTELTVEIDMVESHKDYFMKTWPKAMEKLKELAEKN